MRLTEAGVPQAATIMPWPRAAHVREPRALCAQQRRELGWEALAPAWSACPAGRAQRPRPLRYRVLDARGTPVGRVTAPERDADSGRYFHALAEADQPLADAIVDTVQRACERPRDVGASTDGARSDIERRALARIALLDAGELRREAEHPHRLRYPLTRLPAHEQSALAAALARVGRRWRFAALHARGAWDAPCEAGGGARTLPVCCGSA